MRRSSGVLMPVFSLPSDYGIGCMDGAAYEFVDKLAGAGQSYWQVLPMGPTGYGDSPYQSFSTFAGNPYFISLKEFIETGCLSEEDCQEASPAMEDGQIDYGALFRTRLRLLEKAFLYRRNEWRENGDFLEYQAENRFWLPEYGLFMALKDKFGNKSYLEWEDERIRRHEDDAYRMYGEELAEKVEFYSFVQWTFQRQWRKLKAYANERGVKIIGDIPIYVSPDSADVWGHPELFQMDEGGRPVRVAGCPPDAFSATGQLWGNPLYEWEEHKKDGYQWWIKRIRKCLEWYDVLRIDHFRGFDEYYSIPYGDKTAEYGSWMPGPGMDLFDALKNQLGELPIIAEDLGFLTDSVRELLKDSGFPGMKVLQFAFDERESSDYLPYHYERNSVVYTGTHDNNTTRGWLKDISKADRDVAVRYLGAEEDVSDEGLTKAMVILAMNSVSDLCIIPMQDYLCLSEEARINTPSTLGGNWTWRMERDAFPDSLCRKIRGITRLSGRLAE